MKIPMIRWAYSLFLGALSGFAILGGEATFLRQLPPSRGHVLLAVGSCIVIAFLATLAAARWVWPHTNIPAIVIRPGKPNGE